MANIIEVAEQDISVKLEAAKKAFSDKDLDAYAKAKQELEEAVSQYNDVKQKALYREFNSTGAPFVEFAKAFTYEGKKVTETKDNQTKVINGIAVVPAARRLNLAKFVEYASLDSSVISDIKKLLTLLTIRENNILTLSHEDLVKKSPFFVATVRKKAEGETPDSNTQLCKHIQGILDKCGIEGRVINIDMHWLQQCAFVHNAKAKAQVKPVNDSRFISIFVDLMNHFAEGTPYTVLIKKRASED